MDRVMNSKAEEAARWRQKLAELNQPNPEPKPAA